MRRLDDALGGGLGRGRLGVVASRAGVGKTPLLVHLAVDALLADRKVLHVSHEHNVEHVRAYYDEILLDLAARYGLEEVESVRLELERNRLILSTLGYTRSVPPEVSGARAALGKLRESVSFARDVADFHADLLIVDGLDFTEEAADTAAGLVELAQQANAALWAAVTVDARSVSQRAPALPSPLDQLAGSITGALFLEPDGDEARLWLLQSNGKPIVRALGLRFQPQCMRVVDQGTRDASERPRDPHLFRLVSGGSKGAEAEFGACAERWGLRETNYSFDGHDSLVRERGVVVLGEAELGRGDVSLLYASKRLGRELSGIPAVRQVLQSICHQITEANQVFVVGTIQRDDTVRGGTGWGVELARTWNKPLWVFDQRAGQWFRWAGTTWEPAVEPTITRESFAGIGTQKLNDQGRAAIRELFERTFGPA